MKVLVTGSNGFIGKHMCLNLKRRGHSVFEYDINNTESELKDYVSNCDYIINLAGVNRPLTPEEFYDGNTNFEIAWENIEKKFGRKKSHIYEINQLYEH